MTEKTSLKKFLQLFREYNTHPEGWSTPFGALRFTASESVEFCPITFVVWKKTGVRFSAGNFHTAACLINLDEFDSIAIATAADDDRGSLQSIREQLLAIALRGGKND